MFRDREIKRTNGSFIYLEKPDLGVIVKDGTIVNQEAWEALKERTKQSSYIPTQQDRMMAEQKQKDIRDAELEFEKQRREAAEKKVDELTGKVDKLTELMEKVLNEKGRS